MQHQESIFSSQVSVEEMLKGAIVQIEQKDRQLKVYESQISWLTEQLMSLQRSQFGSKSERWESQEQMKMFNEAELESRNPQPAIETEIQVAGHTKKRGHRQALPGHLPREIVKIELPIEEQQAETGEALKVIGWEISEKLKYEPAKTSVIEYHRAKYGVDSGDYIKTAPPVPSVIPQGIATPELLAAVIVGKYADGLPLYRMEQMFLRQDIELGRGSMGRWIIQVAKSLQPIWNVLSDRLRSSIYVACDETNVQVLKENGRKAESKSWMWVRSTPGDEQKIVLFDYSTSRGSDVAKELFADYKGILQTDGLSSYHCLESKEIIRIGCNMHGRRKFEQAAKDGAQSGKDLASIMMNWYRQIYDFEEIWKVQNLGSEKIKELRDIHIRPIFIEMKSWSEQHREKVPDKSKIGQAIRYFLSEYEYLIGYLKYGYLNPDNGFTERAIRKFAIGRNNWMFSDTPEGAEASALMYSLVVTAKVNGVNPYRALVKILTEIPLAKSIDDYEQLANLILTPQSNA